MTLTPCSHAHRACLLALVAAIACAGASTSRPPDTGNGCGNGTCDATETAQSCPADCASVASGAIIADHHAVQRFDAIPSTWLEKAKALTLHYAHTSHGSQIVSGLAALEARNGTYSAAVRESGDEGLPPAENPAALRIYDGNPPSTYITPEAYWDGSDGQAMTRAVAATGHYGLSMWSWCGQQSSNDTATVQRYLAAMSAFETEFPTMRFILMTGHTDGTDTPSTPGTLKYNNRLVREYAIAHGKVLFDFEDIESWDPAGVHHPSTTDACDWCASWCASHAAECAGLPSECAHSHGFNCVQKAKAFWWMMARLAGWDGT